MLTSFNVYYISIAIKTYGIYQSFQNLFGNFDEKINSIKIIHINYRENKTRKWDINQVGKRKRNTTPHPPRNRYREKKLSGLQIQEFLQEINYKHTD